jgi:hypothetical protein
MDPATDDGVSRRKPLRTKKGKESLKALVDKCARTQIFTTKTMLKHSRWERAYIFAFYALYESKQMRGYGNTHFALIEHLVKPFKSHHTATNFDAGFINGFAQVVQGVIANN